MSEVVHIGGVHEDTLWKQPKVYKEKSVFQNNSVITQSFSEESYLNKRMLVLGENILLCLMFNSLTVEHVFQLNFHLC